MSFTKYFYSITVLSVRGLSVAIVYTMVSNFYNFYCRQSFGVKLNLRLTSYKLKLKNCKILLVGRLKKFNYNLNLVFWLEHDFFCNAYLN